MRVSGFVPLRSSWYFFHTVLINSNKEFLIWFFSDTDSPGGGGNGTAQNSYSQVLGPTGVAGESAITTGGGGGGLSSPDNTSQSSAEAVPVTTTSSNNHTVASSSEDSPQSTAAMQAYQNASAFPGMANAGFYASQSQSPYGMLQQSYPMADG